MTEKLKLLKKDVLIKPKDINDVSNSLIHIFKEDEQKEKLNFFEVLAVSDQVTMVKEGDIVLLEFLQHTIPMLWNDEKCAITSEDDIAAVIEE